MCFFFFSTLEKVEEERRRIRGQKKNLAHSFNPKRIWPTRSLFCSASIRSGLGGLVWFDYRLPVVSLLRFKAVCKSWLDLIQSSSFIDLHTTTAITTTLNSSDSSSSSEFGSFIVHVHCPDGTTPLLMLSSPSYDDSESEEESVSISGGSCSNDDQEVVVDDLGFDMHGKTIAGSCNGLVCMHDRHLTRHRTSKPPIEVYLWNPATGQGATLPESITIRGGIFSLFVFGFDVETKDYKVVRFTCLFPRWRNGYDDVPECCFSRVQVYSLSTNSWRLLKGIPCLPGYLFQHPQAAVYLNGDCFFLAHYFYTERYPCLHVNDRFIISFDFTKEIITPIQLPDHNRDQDLCLCSLGHDKIALFTSTTPYEARIRCCQDFNVWVLNYERGSSVNKESWKKLHSFQLQLERPVQWKRYTPSGISNDGKFALLTSEHCNKMNLYNFATKEVKRDFLSCRLVKSKAHPYKLSLVSVLGGNGAGEMVQGAAAAADDDMVIENSATNL